MTKLPQDTLMFREAHETAGVVERQLSENEGVVGALAERLRAHPPRMVVTCARGSSDHAAMYAKYVFETQLGVVTASASPSVTSIYHAKQGMEGALYIAVSQSGKSPDLVRNAEAAKQAGAYVVALVNVVDSPPSSPSPRAGAAMRPSVKRLPRCPRNCAKAGTPTGPNSSTVSPMPTTSSSSVAVSASRGRWRRR